MKRLVVSRSAEARAIAHHRPTCATRPNRCFLRASHPSPRLHASVHGTCNPADIGHRHCSRHVCAAAEVQAPGDASTSDPASESLFETTVKSGRLQIKPVNASDVTGACVVMTRAFATTDEDISLSSATAYVKSLLGKPGKGTLLVARLFPTDPALLPPNQESRIVGVVALSFHPDTMQPCPSLPPPSDVAYLSNMAVDLKLRRQGIARALLSAAAQATVAAGHSSLYLHVKLSDDAAQKLYLGSGYQEVSRDNVMVKFKGIKPRILMQKQL